MKYAVNYFSIILIKFVFWWGCWNLLFLRLQFTKSILNFLTTTVLTSSSLTVEEADLGLTIVMLVEVWRNPKSLNNVSPPRNILEQVGKSPQGFIP